MMLFENEICNFRDKIEFWAWRTNFASSFLSNQFDFHSKNNFLKNCSGFLYDVYKKLKMICNIKIENENQKSRRVCLHDAKRHRLMFRNIQYRQRVLHHDSFCFQRRYNVNFASLKCLQLALQFHWITYILYAARH